MSSKPIDYLRRRAALKACFSGLTGEKGLEVLYKFCHGGQSTYVPGDSHATSYREGQRSVFVMLLHAMKFRDEREEMVRLEEARDE